MSELFIGYMSGTSCDGVDASLVRTDGQTKFAVIANGVVGSLTKIELTDLTSFMMHCKLLMHWSRIDFPRIFIQT